MHRNKASSKKSNKQKKKMNADDIELVFDAEAP